MSEAVEEHKKVMAESLLLLDAIEVIEGLEQELRHHIRLDAVRPYYAQECREVRSMLSIPLILVGGMRKLQDMEAIIDDGVADAISMCRPFIMEPHIIKSFRDGLTNS